MISTHVLDTALGRPASGVPVRLQVRRGGTWSDAAQGQTNADGRVPGMPVPDPDHVDAARLIFAVTAYFLATGQSAFYEEISVEFTVADWSQKLHVPLLLSPFGYTTYRGS
jgi:5-hydroxyisourate hydrolase